MKNMDFIKSLRGRAYFARGLFWESKIRVGATMDASRFGIRIFNTKKGK